MPKGETDRLWDDIQKATVRGFEAQTRGFEPQTLSESSSPRFSLEDVVEFAENREPRCPCVLLLDTSGSMHGEKLDALNKGLQAFRADLLRDPVASKRVEIAVVAFDNEVRVVQDFVTAERFEPPTLTAQGITRMGAAIHTALDMVQARKDLYNEVGATYYQPWVFMITDGDPQGELFTFVDDAGRRARTEETKNRLVFYTVAVEGADVSRLMRMGLRKPIRLQGLKFEEMFIWLSRSMHAVAGAKGGKLSLPNSRWAAR